MEYITFDPQMKNIVLYNLKKYLEENSKLIQAANTELLKSTGENPRIEHCGYNPNRELRNCPVLILTANNVERQAITNLLLMNLPKDGKIHHFVADKINYQIARINLSGSEDDCGTWIAHVHSPEMGSSHRGSSYTVEAALKRFNPSLVVSLGCAYGWNPNKDNNGQSLGDVLFMRECISMDNVKRIDQKLKLQDNLIHKYSDTLHPYLQNFFTSDRKRFTLNDTNISVFFGSILCGHEVLSDLNEKGRIGDAVHNMNGRVPIGGEMEGTGVYEACEKAKKETPWLIIKGICDWGMEKNAWKNLLNDQTSSNEGNKGIDIKDCIQAIATKHAFLMLCEFLKCNPLLLQRRTVAGLPEFFDEKQRARNLQAIKRIWLFRGSDSIEIAFWVVCLISSFCGIAAILAMVIEWHEKSSFSKWLPIILVCCFFIQILTLIRVHSKRYLATHFELFCDLMLGINPKRGLFLRNSSAFGVYDFSVIVLKDSIKARIPTICAYPKKIEELKAGEAISISLFNMDSPDHLWYDVDYDQLADEKFFLEIHYVSPENIQYVHWLEFQKDRTIKDTVFQLNNSLKFCKMRKLKLQ